MSYPTIEPALFNLDNIEEAITYLNLNGFVVIKNILTSDEKTNFLDLFAKEVINPSSS